MDLISFEDLVVQPYNSYFTLEKELHEVKSQLSLMEQRLKYLEEKKPKKKRHVKQEDTDVKEYEIIEKKIQNDADRKQRLINRNEVRKKNEELQLKRKEEWEKWDKEREEELERRKKNEEEHERKKNENEKYWNSRHEYWKKREPTYFTEALERNQMRKMRQKKKMVLRQIIRKIRRNLIVLRHIQVHI